MKRELQPTELLQQLVNVDSTTRNSEGLTRVIELIRDYTKGLPLTWTTVDVEGADSFLVANPTVVEPGLPSIVLSGHIDTVYGPKHVFDADKPPYTKGESYEAKLQAKRMYGPGTSDMLGSVVVMLETCQRLHKSGSLKNITLALSPEEEIVTPNHRDTIQMLAQDADLILVYEATSALNGPGSRSVVRSRRGGGMYVVEINGPGGHSGQITKKHERHSTHFPAGEFLLAMEREVPDYDKNTTCNIGIIDGLSKNAFNVLSPSTVMRGEFRCVTPEEYQRASERIAQLFQEVMDRYPALTGSIDMSAGAPPMPKTTAEDPYIEVMHQVAKELGIEFTVQEDRGGISEANLFKFANSKAAVIDGMGALGDGEHTFSEYVELDSIDSSVAFSEAVLRKLLQNRNG